VQRESLRFHRLSPAEQRQRSAEFLDRIQERRTVREFSPEPVDFGLIENAVGNRRWFSAGRAACEWIGHPHPHAQPDGISVALIPVGWLK
jgi:hypothetical protein